MTTGTSVRLAALLILVPGLAMAQSAGPCAVAAAALPGSAGAFGDYARVAGLASGVPGDVVRLRPSSATADEACLREGLWPHAAVPPAAGPRVAVTPVAVDVVSNSAYRKGPGYGLLWPGRGVGSMASAGVQGGIGVLSFGVVPAVAWQQNREFEMVERPRTGFSEFGHPWRTSIDLPYRHGPESFTSVSPGQSYLRADLPWLSAGVSSENLWWGPGMRNAILLGNDAPGFPHLFLGSGPGWETRVGRFGVETVWGRLQESPYFDSNPDNDVRFLSALIATWQPPGPTGLTLGAIRMYHRTWEPGGLAFRDFVPFFESLLKSRLVTPEDPMGDDLSNQLAGLFVRYAPLGSGFEVYGEWGREDHSWDMDDLLAEPEHSHAYTLGFQQVLGGADRWYRIRGELTNLNPPQVKGRSAANWYAHSQVRQGHTHRGQILGAAIGTGSDSQYLGFDLFLPRGMHGVHLERVRYDQNTFVRHVEEAHGFQGHDVEVTAGTTHLVHVRGFSIRTGLSVSSRRNRDFIHCNNSITEYRYCQQAEYRDVNWHIPVGVFWRGF
jgi:hypothetical protein